MIKVWDTETGLPILTLRGHNRPVNRVAFDRQGTSLVSAGGSYVKIWDGHPAFLVEQGRLFTAGTRIRQPRSEWSAEKHVQGSFRLVNVGEQPLSVPNFGKVGHGVQVII